MQYTQNKNNKINGGTLPSNVKSNPLQFPTLIQD